MSQSDCLLTTSHDSFFKKSLEQKRVAEDFFRAHLPKGLVDKIDLNTLRVEKGSFLDGDHKQLHTDMLFSVKFEAKQSYIYLLTEHQSKPDKQMPLRMLEYVLKVAKHYRSEKTGKLPLVIPLVYYHGKQSPYPYSTDIKEQFEYPILAQEYLFKPFQLIDMTTIPDGEIAKHRHAAAMEMLQKHVYNQNILPIIDFLLNTNLLKLIANFDDTEYLESMLNYIYYQSDSQQTEELTKKLAKALPKSEEQVMTIAQRIAAKGELEGMQKGMRVGREAVVKEMSQHLSAEGLSEAQIIRIINRMTQESLTID